MLKRGGGHKRLYVKSIFDGIKETSGRIVTIEYNPNRNAYICLIHYRDGENRYILHPRGVIIGDIVVMFINFCSLTNSQLSISYLNDFHLYISIYFPWFSVFTNFYSQYPTFLFFHKHETH
ncbi:hypothetical protein PR202_ga06443 [Eleusine coracana subsp. coracana]|uniref:Large ribosomal subunit protein uL2 RNA-binding domain-containing protein n=1 Tax=Eleusine coracana subsp. coracana TaxID=191504 RepID=A0AAV5BVE0_ELECO|nr:hypothetical protein PR202_ga06443 [Eleusine coracana subsp. coracana]